MSQSYSFGGRGAGGNVFGVGFGGSVRGRGGGGGFSEILQFIQMDQSPLYMSQVFGGWDGSSGGVGLIVRGWMRPRRRFGWWIGWQRRGASSVAYQPHLAVGGLCSHMLFHALPNQGDRIFCCWWRCTLSVAAHSIGGGAGGRGGGEKGRWRKC